MSGQRLAGAVLALVVALAAAGCSAPAATPSSRSDTTSTVSVGATGTPPATIAPDAAYALPLVDGAPLPDPAVGAKSASEIVKPGATVMLTTALLVLTKESVEGTMVADVVELDGPGRTLVVRVVAFDVAHRLTSDGRPAMLTIPKGTLVRVTLPDTRRKAKPVQVTDLVAGRIVGLRVRIAIEPRGTVIRLLSVNGEGGV